MRDGDARDQYENISISHSRCGDHIGTDETLCMTWEESMDHASKYSNNESYDLYIETSISSDIWLEISSDIPDTLFFYCSSW